MIPEKRVKINTIDVLSNIVYLGIVDELYNMGDDIIPKREYYQEKLEEEIKKLKPNIKIKKFNNLSNLVMDILTDCEEQSFIYGFKIAFRLMKQISE